MSDPFESMLADALSAPDDLELGHEMRRRLLAAAVPAGKAAADNVVPFEVPDPDAAAGFDWLVGDAPATLPLIRRMSRDPGFFAVLDAERHFLRSLRHSLRKSTAVVPKRRPRVVLTAAAAALALAAGTLFAFRGASPEPTGFAATAGSNSPAGAVSPRAVVTRMPDHKVLSPIGTITPSNRLAPPQRTGIGGAPWVEGLSNNSDVWPATPSEVTTLPFCLETAGAATFGDPDYGIATIDESPESAGSLLVSNDVEWSRADFIDSGFAGRQDLSFSTGESDSPVPEPGGMLPILIGCLMLLLHRSNRRKS